MDKGSPCAVWDFRVSSDGLLPEKVIETLKKVAKQYCFQGEQGDSGYKHYQGRISLIKKRRGSEKHILLKLFSDGWEPNYLAPTTNSAVFKGELFYVMKEDTRISGPWTDKDVESEEFIPEQWARIDINNMHPFQMTIWNNINSSTAFNSREINLVYCPDGNKGKSTIAHIARLRRGCIVIPAIINDAKELIQCVCDICMDGELRSPPAVFIDMPRAINKQKLFGLYSAIEVIKDGYLYDVRHHFRHWDINSPQVWVFTNSLPDYNLLSKDRWNVWTINECLALSEYCPDVLVVPVEQPSLEQDEEM